MVIPPERLIDGCVETLRDEVLPNLEARTARGRLYAVMDVLQNLRDRVDPKAAALEAESTSARTALERIAAALRAAGAEAAAGAVEEALAAALSASPADGATACGRRSSPPSMRSTRYPRAYPRLRVAPSATTWGPRRSATSRRSSLPC